jgi:hypothetical protein
MSMIRVFPRRTKWTPDDELAFVGDPPLPLLLPPEQPVRISITFTWDIPEGYRLLRAWSKFYKDVRLGGPAFGDPGGEFTPGMFLKKGVTITSRGCIRNCPYCLVPEREGKIRELPIKEGWIIQDNNLLACSEKHIEKVFEMLSRQKKAAVFSGGLDPRLLNRWHVCLLKSIKVREIWVSCDTTENLRYLYRAAELLQDFPMYKKRCYVLVGFGGETIQDAEKRLKEVYELGFLPFAQLYRGPQLRQSISKDWKRFVRMWSRPAIYKFLSRKKESCPLLEK